MNFLYFLIERYPGLVTLQKSHEPTTSVILHVESGMIAYPRYRAALKDILRASSYAYHIPQAAIYADDLDLRFYTTRNTLRGITAINDLYEAYNLLNDPKPFYLEDAIPYINVLLLSPVKRAMRAYITIDPPHGQELREEFSMPKGWGNGYVGVSVGHPWFQKYYMDIQNVHIHGGLTYASHTLGGVQEDEENIDTWWVGFDTGHFMDTPERWSKEDVRRETARLYLQACDALLVK
jgi:hypothetical protein